MTKSVKSIFTAIIIGVIAAMGITATAASGTGTSNKAELYLKRLNVLGIMSETDDLSKTLTRGEMAKIICGVGGYNVVTSEEKIFSDVPRDYVYADYINTAYNYGIINGTGNGMFSPDETVTREQMYKMLLCTAGYQMFAEQSGGYPSGYLSLADNNDMIMAGTSGEVTVLEAAYSTFMALDMPVVRVVPGVSVSSNVRNDTLLNNLLVRGDMEIAEGILTFDGYTSVSGDETPNSLTVAVDGRTMRNNGAELGGLIGKRIEYFTRDGVMIAAYEYPGKNNTVKFTADNIESLSGTSAYTVYTDSSRQTTYRLSDSAYVVYNMQGLSGYTEEYLLPDYGDVTLIDNNDDNRYEVVMVNNKKYYVVDDASSTGLSVQYKRYSGQNESGYSIAEDDLNNSVYYAVTDADGNKLSNSAVSKDCVVGVSKSIDGSMINVVVTKNAVSGTLEASGSESLTVDGNTYDIIRDRSGRTPSFDVRVGDIVTAYLNENDMVVYCETQGSAKGNYAYIKNVYLDDDGRTWKMQAVMSGSLGSLENRKYYWVKDKMAYNDRIENYEIGTITRINGEKRTEELINSIKNEVVELSFNSSGAVISIKTMQPEFEYTTGKYNHNTSAMVQNNLQDLFDIDYDNPAVLLSGNVNTLVIPKADAESYGNEEYLAKYRIENDSAIYNIAFYDIPEGSQTPRLLVLKEALNEAGTAQDDASTGILISDLGTAFDDGENYWAVTVYTAEGSERDILIREDAKLTDSSVKTDISQLKRGDVVEFSWDSNGKANSVNIVASAADPIDRMQMGVVEKTQRNVIWNRSNGDEFYNLFYYINNYGERIEAGVRADYPIFRYNGRRVEKIEMSDVVVDPDGVDGDTVIIAGKIAVILPKN